MREVLKGGGPLLVDSAALKAAFPGESAHATLRTYGRGARLVSEASAVNCTPGTLRCSTTSRGALVIVRSVQRVHADTATVEFTARWTVDSDRRGSTVVSSNFELLLVRRPQGWIVKDIRQLRET